MSMSMIVRPFSAKEVSETLTAYKHTLMLVKGREDFVHHAVEVIRARLYERPADCLAYGPYWWAVKAILIKYGALRDCTVDPAMADLWCGDTDEETIVMAERFREVYEQSSLAGTRCFVLDPLRKDEVWELHDPDLDSRIRMEEMRLEHDWFCGF